MVKEGCIRYAVTDDKVTILTMRKDYKGATLFWNKVMEFMKQGYVFYDSTERSMTPSLQNIPKVTLIKKVEEKKAQPVEKKAPAKKSEAKKSSKK